MFLYLIYVCSSIIASSSLAIMVSDYTLLANAYRTSGSHHEYIIYGIDPSLANYIGVTAENKPKGFFTYKGNLIMITDKELNYKDLEDISNYASNSQKGNVIITKSLNNRVLGVIGNCISLSLFMYIMMSIPMFLAEEISPKLVIFSFILEIFLSAFITYSISSDIDYNRISSRLKISCNSMVIICIIATFIQKLLGILIFLIRKLLTIAFKKA